MNSTVSWGSGGRPGRFGYVQRLRTILRCQSRTVAGVTSNADQRQRGRRRATRTRNARSGQEKRARGCLRRRTSSWWRSTSISTSLSNLLKRRVPSSSMTRRTSKKRNESATDSYHGRRVGAGQAGNRVSAPHRAVQKFKRLRRNPIRAWQWLKAARRRQPKLFAHWHLLARPAGRSVGAVGRETVTYGSARAGGGGSLPLLTRE